MGTGGVVGVRFNSECRLCYQSHDASPSCLGEEIVSFVKKLHTDPLKMLTFVENIQTVEWADAALQPTPEQVEKLHGNPEILIHLDYNTDWYTQFIFDPLECLEYVTTFGLSVIPEHKKCEFGTYNYGSPIQYAYIINLDIGVLELYRHCCLMGQFPFEEISGAQNDTWFKALLTWEDC